MDGSRMPDPPYRRPRSTLALLATLILAGSLWGDTTSTTGSWKFDVLRLKSGKVLTGLVVEETASGIRFQVVRQEAGKRTFVHNPTTFPHSEVISLAPLRPEERKELAARIRKLDPQGTGERLRMNDLDLKPIAWGKDKKGGLSYRSEYFILESNAREDIVRRAALRLEDIYAAYSIRLPPRRKAAAPTRILLFESQKDLVAFLQEQRMPLFNHAAFYDPARNLIVCASDLKVLGESLELLREKLKEYRAELKATEDLYRDKKTGKLKPMPDSIREMIATSHANFNRAEQSGDKAFHNETLRLFQTLYHEAFHAYLAGYVFPPGKDEPQVPRWLNEGLAQIFENAIVEAGDLRVGHADEARLKRARAGLIGKPEKVELLPLAELLRADPKQFLVVHSDNRQLSDRLYLTSWALAFYLTFERQLLRLDRLDSYVRACKPGNEVPAFEALVGQRLPEFEKSFHQYLRTLRPDGSTGPTTVREPG
jgi:hypothetical protein